MFQRLATVSARLHRAGSIGHVYFSLSNHRVDILTKFDFLDNIRAGVFDLVIVISSDRVHQIPKHQTTNSILGLVL